MNNRIFSKAKGNFMELGSFKLWAQYDGLLYLDEEFNLEIYGYMTNTETRKINFSGKGTAYGIVESGEVIVANQNEIRFRINTYQWFCLVDLNSIELSPHSKICVIMKRDFLGVNSMGGPLENQGRLKYIDGCTDSLLVFPPTLGDPCLNHLHFPPGILQTSHTHPSCRTGIVLKGQGECITPFSETVLNPGTIFYLPKNAYHNFKTNKDILDVAAFHPDSDWGPTHEEHPMINRTWVNNKKISNV